jgi:hypothetical protein
MFLVVNCGVVVACGDKVLPESLGMGPAGASLLAIALSKNSEDDRLEPQTSRQVLL